MRGCVFANRNPLTDLAQLYLNASLHNARMREGLSQWQRSSDGSRKLTSSRRADVRCSAKDDWGLSADRQRAVVSRLDGGSRRLALRSQKQRQCHPESSGRLF
jgi:hypothetical protein